jgi:hypothetical protein
MPMFCVVPPVVPVVVLVEPPFLTWYSGPVYLLERLLTVLYAATHGVFPDE